MLEQLAVKRREDDDGDDGDKKIAVAATKDLPKEVTRSSGPIDPVGPTEPEGPLEELF